MARTCYLVKVVEDRQGNRPRRRSDGEQTHAAILAEALRLASVEGLNRLTIGRLAQELGVSKSGVFAHFGGKERLQLETIEAAREVFEREVLEPALAAPEGLGQLLGLCEAFLSYVERGVFPGGCFFAGLLAEFDAQPGPIHQEVAADQREWLAGLEAAARRAQEQGELDPDADAAQLAFELDAALELANYFWVLYRDPAVIHRARTAIHAAIARATSPSHPHGSGTPG
jgi:AcrR family transcriptional regulator